MRILIVEDDTGIAGGLEATLRSVGYAVDVCGTLADAAAALRVETFELVLLDLGLPDGDGIDWLRRLRQEGRTLPVIIMTARDALPDRVAGLDEGADDYLVKPVAPEELLARLRVALRRSEGRASPLLRHGIHMATQAEMLTDSAVCPRPRCVITLLRLPPGQAATKIMAASTLAGKSSTSVASQVPTGSKMNWGIKPHSTARGA